MEFIKKHAVIIVTVILAVHFTLSLLVSTQESMTFDEKAHIPAAYSSVRYGDMRLNPEHPPLIKDFSGLFLLPLGLDFPLEAKEWQEGFNEQWIVGDLFINCLRPEIACNDADTILFFARLPIIILSVVLGITLFLWTKKLAGALGGVIATTLYAFDPNIIAHSHYVTTDIGSALFIFLAFYFFIEFLKSPNRRTILFAGLFLGLAELTKFSAVLLFPFFGLFALFSALTRAPKRHEGQTNSHFVLANVFQAILNFSGIVAVAFVVIWIGYAVNTLGMPAQKVVEHADLFLSQPNTPARIAHDLIVSMAHSPILLPYAEYFVGIAKVFSRVAAGNVHYFLGTVSVDASPWYFPVVFILKSTLPFLLLILTTTLYGLFRIARATTQRTGGLFSLLARSFQSNSTEYLAVSFIFFYAYVSITGNLTIGFRHLFPILPFLYLLVGKTLADIYKRHEEEPITHQLLGIALSIVLFLVIAIPFLSYPSYLSYFNAMTGGHTNGYRYVTDSNYDWGQDLKYLKKWIDRYNACVTGDWIAVNKGAGCKNELPVMPTGEPISKIRVDYFGGSNPATYLGDAYIPWWESREPEAGWYAISSFFYQESLYKTRAPGETGYQWLKDTVPLARAGDSFFIYYFSPDTLPSTTK